MDDEATCLLASIAQFIAERQDLTPDEKQSAFEEEAADARDKKCPQIEEIKLNFE